MLRFIKTYFEVIAWNGALIVLGLMNVNETAGTLCIFKNLGIDKCPGCGLGHAIHYALHFNFKASYEAHILGIPAALVLFYQSCKSIYTINKIKNYESATTTKDLS